MNRPWVIVSGDFVTTGGMDRANYELARYLATVARRTVHLVAIRVESPLDALPNVTVHRVKKPLNSYALADPLLNRRGRRVAAEVYRQSGGRAVVVVNGGNCRWHDVCWVHAVHAAWDRRDAHASLAFRLRARWVKRCARDAERRNVLSARLVVTNSLAAREQIITRIGARSDDVHAVYYGIDADTFRPPTPAQRGQAREQLGISHDKPVVAFIGAMGHDRNKGFDVLFEAFSRLCADPSWDSDLIAIGGGAEVEYWRARAAGAGLSRRIRLLGPVRGAGTLLHAADVLCSPTHYDAYGLGVHEALCCGVPAIVTGSAGVAERYPPELARDLCLRNPSDTEELMQRLRGWRADPEGFRRRVAPFSEQLRRRSWDDMAADFIRLAEGMTAPSEPAGQLVPAVAEGTTP